MEKNKQLYNEYNQDSGSFPWKHVVSFTLCIILAAFTLWGTLYSDYSFKPLLAIISGVAFLQALLQLFYVQPRQ